MVSNGWAPKRRGLITQTNDSDGHGGVTAQVTGNVLVAKILYMASRIWVNIILGHALLFDGAASLPEPMLTNYLLVPHKHISINFS